MVSCLAYSLTLKMERTFSSGMSGSLQYTRAIQKVISSEPLTNQAMRKTKFI
jgi:hypothetical protein